MLSKFKSMDKLDWALLVAQVVCWIEYLPVFILINILFAAILVILSVFLCILLWFAYGRMKSRMTEINEPRIKKLWATLALILAPFSIAFYLFSTYLITNGLFRKLYESGWMAVIFLVSAFIGLYMPFILLTYWLKYRYREDEF
jgi:hypothetical protein